MVVGAPWSPFTSAVTCAAAASATMPFVEAHVRLRACPATGDGAGGFRSAASAGNDGMADTTAAPAVSVKAV